MEEVKKMYMKPRLYSERVAIGVYGNYQLPGDLGPDDLCQIDDADGCVDDD